MSVYVDPMMGWPQTKRWPYGEVSHLIGDDETELHEFAKLIGLKRWWFQKQAGHIPHYDLTSGKRRLAIKHGAIEVNRKQFVHMLRKYRKKVRRRK